MTTPPTDIKLNTQSRSMEVIFADGNTFNFSCEFLRVHSPSAEVQGHSPGQEVLQLGKETVNITKIEPVGHYAVKLHFDDGHDSGLYSWKLLHHLGLHHDELWQNYLDKVRTAGIIRPKP